MSHSIQAIKFKTSNPEKFAILVGSTEEKVDQSLFNKGMIICLDSSGSMNARFIDPDSNPQTQSQSTGLSVNIPPVSAALPSSSPATLFNPTLTTPQSAVTPLSSFNFTPMPPGPMSNAIPFDISDTLDIHSTPGFFLNQTQDVDIDDTPSYQTPVPISAGFGFGASNPNSSLFASPAAPPPAGAAPLGLGTSRRNYTIQSQTRLGCVDSFMGKIFDLFDFVEKTQGIKVPLSVVVFGTRVQVISNLEESISYQTMKLNTTKALTQGGGTNYELAIEETKKLKPKYSGDVTTIFLSDGGHSDGSMKKEKLIETYPNFFNYCIGLGEGDSDYDETTLKGIGEEFIRGTNPQRIRDFVAGIALGIATMRAKNIHITSSNPNDILVGNMEKKDDGYRHKEMSMLMELYFSITNTANLHIQYEKSDGTKMEFTLDDTTSIEDDVEYGDKVLHTMDILETISKISDSTKDMNPMEKLKFLNDFKRSITENPITKTCLGTRIHNYYLTVMSSIDKMILTKDERKLRDLTKNVKSDVYNTVSSASADVYCSPASASNFSLMTPGFPMSALQTSSNKNKITNVKCNICCSNDREIVFIPCGHFLSCSTCSLNPKVLEEGCPYCRSKIDGFIPVVLDSHQKDDDWDMVCQNCHREHVSCISKDCSHIFSCLKCIERQKRHIKRAKTRIQWLDVQISELKEQGKDYSLLEKERDELDVLGKKEVQCTICDKKCSAYIEVHI